MADIQVVHRTQRIVVNVASGSVGIVQAGPVGPRGFAGTPTPVGSGAPAGTGADGDFYYDLTNDRFYVSDGVGWTILSEPMQTVTPSLTNLSIGTGGGASAVTKYHRSDGYCDFSTKIVLGSSGFSVGTAPLIGIPKEYSDGTEFEMMMAAFYDLSTTTKLFGAAYGQTTTTIGLRFLSPAGGTIVSTGISSTSPFTWAAGDQLMIAGRYRMATRYL